DALKKVESTKVALEIIHSAVGSITESDVLLASASKAIILGFHTRIDTGVSDIAKREGVQIKLYAIIYELIDEVKEAMAGLLEPIVKEIVSGAAEVRKVFSLSKGGNVAGCVVTSGRIVKGKVRVQRRKGLIFEGVTASLRRFQDEVNDVRLAGDLQSATIFVGIVGTSEQQRKGLELLKKERLRIQGLLGRAVVLKYTPKLRFVRDDSVERGNRVLQILEELERTLPPS